MTGIIYKKGKFGHRDMHTETTSGENECRDWGNTSTSQRMPEI